MVALGIELLMRRAVIACYDRREEAEWPPHPDRVFMALVAGFGETGKEPGEEAALKWLESQPAPKMAVSLQASHRGTFTSYVPVNDDSAPAAKDNKTKKFKPYSVMGSLPIGRNRQARNFSAVVPESPTVFLNWDAELPSEHRAALESLCAKAAYLGHSSTPVRMWVEDAEVDCNLVPNGKGSTQRLRVFGNGRLAYLMNRYQAELRPQPGLWQSYGSPVEDLDDSSELPFDPGMIILRQVGGRRFPLESSGMIADALRATLMARHGGQSPNWLSGHSGDGSQSTSDRPAIVPLAFVDHKHADGHLLGIAIALPSNFSPEYSQKLFELLLQEDPLKDRDLDESLQIELGIRNFLLPSDDKQNGKLIGTMRLELDERRDRQREFNLRMETWTNESTHWATVTPVMLPRFPRRSLLAEEVVAQAIVEAGYPMPVEVETGFAPFMSGVPHSKSFIMKPRPGRPPRPLVHARFRFDVPVRGPVLVGAGRYTGFGACRPLAGEESP